MHPLSTWKKLLKRRLKSCPKAAHCHEVQIEALHSEGEGTRGAEQEAGAAAEGGDVDGGRGQGECGDTKGGGAAE